MIRFTYKPDRQKLLIRIEVTGHADTAPKGRDLVCAAATILAATARQKACDLHRGGLLREEPHYTIRDGQLRMSLQPTAEAFDAALVIFGVIDTGFRLLAADYPQAVTVVTAKEPTTNKTESPT